VGGKPELLRRAWDFAVVGDDEPVPMVDRPAVRRLQQQSDVRVAVRGWARVATGVSARVAPLARVLVAAADADPDVAELLAIVEDQRLTGARTFVSWVQSHGGLRRGVTTKRAAELCWVQIDPSVYRRLVLERGWTVRQFERYLADVIEAAILPGRT
jgi:hypothetical protein